MIVIIESNKVKVFVKNEEDVEKIRSILSGFGIDLEVVATARCG